MDKPLGLSSAAVVARVRRAAGMVKAGHGGTLDPLATGVLPIALGEATKTVSYVIDGAKRYRFVIRWGEQRSTDDAEGEVIATSEVRPDAAAITAVLDRFTGEIEQIPPTYSAIKVSGKRAYALARADVAVTLPPRQVNIDAITLESVPDADHAVFVVRSGKGVYMRSLARDMALTLGTRGYIAQLRRLAVGPFDEEQAITLDRLDEIGHSGTLTEALLPVGRALADIPALQLTAAEARRLQHGQPIAVLPVASRSPLPNVAAGAVVCAITDGKPVALAEIKGGELRPLRVLNCS
ncbi:MAG: tRNA pseudouridine(55) synthase TruB [Rhodospirillales bacterium]|nr:tRNA pseudouridine(55) synthase TruB [Rhodospirillales bacterium]